MSEEIYFHLLTLGQYPPDRYGHDTRRFNNKEALVDMFERLHEFNNPQQVSCDKLSEGRGSHASADVITGFVPTGVIVMHKVLLTAVSPHGVADAVLACKVGPDEGATKRMFVSEPLWRFCYSGKSMYVSEYRNLLPSGQYFWGYGNE